LREVAHGARTAFNNSIATVYAFHDDPILEKRRFIGVARDGYEGADIDESAGLPEDSLLRKLLHLSEPAFIIDGDLLLTRHARGQNLQSAIGMALRFGNQTVGVLMLGYRYVRSWSIDEIEEVQRFGRLVATIICQTQLLDQTRRQVQALTALHEAGQTIARHTSREDTIQRILEQALDLLGADRERCISHLALVKGDALEFHTNRPELLQRRRRVNLRREPRIGISGRVVTDRVATNVPDVLLDPDYVPFEDGIRSQISVPVMSADRLIGVLSVEHTSPRAFSDDDQHNLELLAAQAAIGLENAALHEQLEAIRAVARVSVVGELSNILRAIVREARSRLGCDVAVIYTHDESVHRFVQADCDGCDPSHLKDPGALGEQSATWRLITAEPMAHTPPGEDGHWLIDGAFARSHGLRSSLAMALTCRDADGVERRVGVLFISYTAEILFGPEDEERAKDLAQLAAISILNAQRHEQLRSLERSRRAGLALAGLTVMTNTWMHSVYNDVNGIDQHLAAIDRYLVHEPNIGEVRASLREVRSIIARLRDERRRPPQSPDDEQTLIPINDFIHERVQQLSERSQYGKVRFELGDLASEMAVVRANKHQLQRALEIIIDNAARAVAALEAQRRCVTISSRVIGGDVEICIQDDGPGISPDVLSQLELQQPIRRLNKAGLGYGLVLAWFIAELHRGRLEFANRRPFGATVSVRLPLLNTEDTPT
jgi:GAF domain-containing protein/anti-sigma regulatory factor (Ser/Thr protein kinase)